MEPNPDQLLNFKNFARLVGGQNGDYSENPITPRLSQFRLSSILGEGTFGVVYKADCSIFKDRKVALKIFKHWYMVDEPIKEGNLLIELVHNNIIKCLGAFFHFQPILIMELGNCNIMKYKPTVDEAVVILNGLLKGLQYLHKKGYLHCDLKPDNLIICKGQAKLLDLGSATKIDKGKKHTILKWHKGTFCYQPLVTLSYRKVNISTDLFGLAVSIWESITRNPLMSPKGNWIRKVAKNRAEMCNYFKLVHEYGRFDEGKNTCKPFADEYFKNRNLQLSNLIADPHMFSRTRLSERFRLGDNLEKEMLITLQKMTGFLQEQVKSSAEVWEIPEFKQILERAKDTDLPYKHFKYPGLHETSLRIDKIPKLTDENLHLALNFYHVNKAELIEKPGSTTPTLMPVELPVKCLELNLRKRKTMSQ